MPISVIMPMMFSICVEHCLRQVVVDLGVGQVAAFLAQYDQLFRRLRRSSALSFRERLRFDFNILIVFGSCRHYCVLENRAEKIRKL